MSSKKTTEQLSSPSRRQWLQQAGKLTALTAVVATGASAIDEANAAPAAKDEQTGYRETQHIKDYYASL